ncbi:MAG: gephyrin-like molybdotransferase Glp, partial [Chitinophagales bacterium]
MISVTEAKEKVISNTTSLTPVVSVLGEAGGKVLAEDVYSRADIPAFDQSSMDGYAFSFQDWKSNQSLEIRGEIAAGGNEVAGLLPGNAVRIFTGAAIPPGADTVVMQEKTRIQNDYLAISDENIVPGLNVRKRGSEIKAGDLALAKDSLLTPAAIGFLAGIGITEVLIYPFPSISIIVTGNELQEPGRPLQPGQVYESNSFSLRTALKQLHINEVRVYKAEDKLEKVTQVLNEALKQSDIVFLTGGVSVGDYDFVATAAAQNGIEKIFHKIKQRPGKPLFFGKMNNKLIFGLPGNPASVLTCFYEYAEPALKKMIKQKTGIQIKRAPLAGPFKKAAGLTHFLKGFYNGETVTALHAQESYRLSS